MYSPNPSVLKIKSVFTSVYGLSTLKINVNCMCTHTFHLLMFGEKLCAILSLSQHHSLLLCGWWRNSALRKPHLKVCGHAVPNDTVQETYVDNRPPGQGRHNALASPECACTWYRRNSLCGKPGYYQYMSNTFLYDMHAPHSLYFRLHIYDYFSWCQVKWYN